MIPLGERIAPQHKRRLEDTAACLVRNPLSLKKLVYLDGQQAVLYRSKLSPFLGRNFEARRPSEPRPAVAEQPVLGLPFVPSLGVRWRF